MILSICPNPSIDCTIELDSLKLGGLNRVENKIITYSGKAINVAIGVSRLNGDSFLTGFMFDGNGETFVRRLDDEKVKNTFVWCKGDARTNYKIVDKRSMMTEINDKGESVSEEKQAELLELVGNLSKNCSVAVISGSLPSGVEDDYYGKLLSKIPCGVKKIVDTTGDKLLESLKSGVFLVKPNLDEMNEIFKRQLQTTDEMIVACRALIEKGTQNVLLSLGVQGALLVDRESAYYCKSTNVAVNSTVGAGDSMISAVAVMTEQNAGKEEVLRSAVAAGTAAVTTSGTNLFYIDKFAEIYDKLKVEKLF